MCFGERLDEGTVRAIAAAQRDQQLYFGSKMAVFGFLPSVTRHLFRDRLDTARGLRRRHRELLVPLIDARREYIKNNNEHSSETTTTLLEHSYVDTLLDVRLPLAGGDESDRPLSEQEVVNLCTEFLTAGTDTTTSAMQWIMAELVKNPDIQNKLYSEIKGVVPDDGQDEVTEENIHGMPYLRAVVLEGLRKHPPSHLVLPHRAAEDVEVGTYLIPKGATVNFMVAEMGRDAEEWENPAEFSPERFLPGGHGEGVDVTGSREIKMMPFGVGRRICPGLGVAMLHVEYLVANMVREFEWKEVAGDEVELTVKRGFTCFMEKPLRPRLVPRKKSGNQVTNNELVLD